MYKTEDRSCETAVHLSKMGSFILERTTVALQSCLHLNMRYKFGTDYMIPKKQKK